MGQVAALWAGWDRRSPRSSAAPQGASFAGVGLFPELPGVRFSVEIAWGADLTADAAAWSWTPVTTDVRTSGISAKLGRNDESSDANPAELTLTLDNTSGDYSLGGWSRYFPWVRRNTPVRLRMETGTGARTIWLGYSTGWSPGWDALNGDIPIVKLSASGTLRRLAQGAEPVISPVRRYLENEPNVVAYWSCEVGEHASVIPANTGTGALYWTGDADLASCDVFVGSNPLPTTNGVAGVGGSFRAQVSSYTPASDFSQGFRSLLAFPAAASAPANDTIIWKTWLQGGSVGRFELQYKTGGGLKVLVYSSTGAFVGSAENLSFGVDGNNYLASLEMYESGGSVFYGLNLLKVGSSTYTSLPGSPSVVGTLGRITEIWIDPSAVIDGIGFGHVAILNSRSASDPLTDVYSQLNGYPGEAVTTRLRRVCSENAVALNIYDGEYDGATFNDALGAQDIDTVLNILREAEEVERGQLWDGKDSGLSYTTRRGHENSVPAFTIDAAAEELAPPFEPIDDDQRTRNRWTVNREGGAEFTIEDTDGDMGTEVIGFYSDSKTINSYADRAARDLADWLVHAGTIVGYRYPTVTLDLRATPRFIEAIVDLYPGARIDIANVDEVLESAGVDTVSLTVEGIEHDIGPRHWRVTLNCSPGEVWSVGTLAADTGDEGEFVLRLDTDGSYTNTVLNAGNVFPVVVTADNTAPYWTTTAGQPDDFPFDLDIGAVEVHVTANGAGGQLSTFTADPIETPRRIRNEAPVKLWKQSVLGL